MKTLQNNYTTPEQSNRLLELGVPADSADFHYRDGVYYKIGSECWLMPIYGKPTIKFETPCWSVGRLIELHEILFPQYKNFIIERDDVTLISRMVKYYEISAKQGALDFSKLED